DAVAKLSRPSPMRRLAKGFDRVERCEFYFFFQAEDGIRDFHVTGVQTCALPISARELSFPGPPGIERFTESGSGSGDTKRAFGRYELLDEIGRGAMGVVYRARHLELGKEVALKVLLAGEDAREAQIARFRREAAAVQKLRHEGIVPIHDFGAEG